MTDTPEMIRQRAYRKRRTDKLARYEATLHAITDVGPNEGNRAAAMARDALYPLRDQLIASLADHGKGSK